jgi:hypothetical protein
MVEAGAFGERPFLPRRHKGHEGMQEEESIALRAKRQKLSFVIFFVSFVSLW